MKFTKLCARFMGGSTDEEGIGVALRAAFGPFGSLTEGVETEELAAAMLRWVNAKEDEQLALAGEIVRLVWSATTDEHSSVELERWGLTLRTPTSGTRIRLCHGGGNLFVEVDFGPEGSESRAVEILAAAERAGVRFDAYAKRGRVERGDVLDALRARARRNLSQLQGQWHGRWSKEEKDAIVSRARGEVAFFAGLA